MAENVYENVAVIIGENKAGVRDDEAPQRRSKVTRDRVALGVLSLLFLAIVAALIMYYNSPFKKHSEAMTEMTTVAVDFTEIQTTPGHTTAAVSICSSVAQCDEDWELNGTQCYYFSPGSLQLNWTNSKEKCQSKRGDLIKIESREEQEFMDDRVRLLMEAWDERFWIGLTDSQTEGEWLWTDGSPLDQSLEFWTKNMHNTEPDNWKEEDEDGENCAIIGEIVLINGLRSWYDISCKKKSRFICEKKAVRSATCS